MALPSASGCLGAYVLRPSWGQHASSGYARLFAAMQDIWVSLHSISSRSTLLRQSFIVNNHFMRHTFSRSCWVSSYTEHRWFEASSRSARLQGLPEAGPARLLAAMLGDLGVSRLRLIKIMTQFSSLFWASNQPCCLLQCSGTTLQVRLRRPLVFLVIPTFWKTRFSSCCYSTYFFFVFFFLG
jgi:hypothetical protein